MSITVNIYYKGTKSNLHKFIDEMISKGIVDKIRKQKGNLKYEYYMPVDKENHILLIDQWESQHSLDEHHSSSMMSDIIELRNKYNLEMHVERFVDDNNSITENDKKFIK